jgi:hypothetical protein
MWRESCQEEKRNKLNIIERNKQTDKINCVTCFPLFLFVRQVDDLFNIRILGERFPRHTHTLYLGSSVGSFFSSFLPILFQFKNNNNNQKSRDMVGRFFLFLSAFQYINDNGGLYIYLFLFSSFLKTALWNFLCPTHTQNAQDNSDYISSLDVCLSFLFRCFEAMEITEDDKEKKFFKQMKPQEKQNK